MTMDDLEEDFVNFGNPRDSDFAARTKDKAEKGQDEPTTSGAENEKTDHDDDEATQVIAHIIDQVAKRNVANGDKGIPLMCVYHGPSKSGPASTKIFIDGKPYDMKTAQRKTYCKSLRCHITEYIKLVMLYGDVQIAEQDYTDCLKKFLELPYASHFLTMKAFWMLVCVSSMMPECDDACAKFLQLDDVAEFIKKTGGSNMCRPSIRDCIQNIMHSVVAIYDDEEGFEKILFKAIFENYG